METTKHTPIPWHYVKGAPPHNQGQVYYEDNGQTLAVTYNDEDGANARLIAAAPDMLAALVAIKTQAEFSATTFPNAPGRGDFLAIARWAGEAIAKAEGSHA